jgi:hypothetical protein
VALAAVVHSLHLLAVVEAAAEVVMKALSVRKHLQYHSR